MEAPIIRGEVNASAAHLPPILDGLERLGLLGFVLAIGDGLDLGVVRQPRLVGVADLIVLVIPLGKIGTLFQHNNAKTGGGEFLRHHAARGARADYQEIDSVRRPERCAAHSLSWAS